MRVRQTLNSHRAAVSICICVDKKAFRICIPLSSHHHKDEQNETLGNKQPLLFTGIYMPVAYARWKVITGLTSDHGTSFLLQIFYSFL